MIDVLLLTKGNEGSSTRLWLEVDDPQPGPLGTSYEVRTVRFALERAAGLATARFVLGRGLRIPDTLLVDGAGGTKRLRTLKEIDELARKEAQKQLDELRRALALRTIVIGATDVGEGRFLDVLKVSEATRGGFQLQIDVSSLMSGTDDSVVLRAVAEISFDAGFESRFGGATAKCTALFQVELTRGFALTLLPRIEVPTLPNVGITWPRIELPETLAGSISVEHFGLPTPDGLFNVALPATRLRINWEGGKKPVLSLKVTNGDLSLTTENPGGDGNVVLIGPRESDETILLKFTGLKIAFKSKKVVVEVATFDSSSPSVLLIDTLELPAKHTGPFAVRIADVRVKAVATGQHPGGPPTLALTLTLTIGRLEIWSRRDPSRILAVSAEITFTVKDGTSDTKLTKLTLLQPSVFELIGLASNVIEEGVRRLWSLIQHIRIPSVSGPGLPTMDDVVAVLRRIGELVEAAVGWLAEQGLAGARALAGLAEAALKLAARVVAELAEAIKNAGARLFESVAIELRIDTATWRLVQIVVTPIKSLTSGSFNQTFLGVTLGADYALTPALVYDIDRSWAAVVLQFPPPIGQNKVHLSTDLWLDRVGGPSEPVTSTDGTTAADKPLLAVEVQAKAGSQTTGLVIALVILGDGRPRFLQRLVVGPPIASIDHVLLGRPFERLEPLTGDDATISTAFESDRILSLFRAPKSGAVPGIGNPFGQYIKVKGGKAKDLSPPTLKIPLDVELTVAEQTFVTTLSLQIDLEDFSMSITSDRKLALSWKRGDPISLLGLTGTFVPLDGKGDKEPFYPLFLDLSDGNPRLALDDAVARLEIAYDKLSSDGRGLRFRVDRFAVARDGIDLAARVADDPVMLAGVDMPFRFESGELIVKRSRIQAFAIRGHGNLPPALVGEARANISLNFVQRDGRLTVQACEAVLDKSADPLRCESTRFTITVTKLGLKFVEQGGYHFYFTLTGAAEFRPVGDEFSSGLLKHLSKLRITLDEAPLASDPRILLKHIEFQIPVEPPSRTNFFDIFSFELRGVGFHPASPVFTNSPPAFSISGQVNFTDFGDVVTPRFDFHKMWIAAPAPGQWLPRIRFDGLGVGLALGSMAQVYGTALTVDGTIPSLVPAGALPSNVTATGFLAAGSLRITGWASMAASMGFLELNGDAGKRHAFFLYIEQRDLSEKIPTPIGPFFLREVGFGFGYRYTLAGLAAADQTSTPRQLVKLLDDVSRLQGDLAKYTAWSPTYDNNNLTLALRGLISHSTASSRGGQYNQKGEKELPNLVLFDVVAALRTDLTFLMNLRAWVAYNYNDWREAKDKGGAPWQTAPSLRGYMYISAPRREFLARAVFEPGTPVGEHPPLPPQLKYAMERVRWSSTLYIRPGLFHMELGWPYELGFSLGEPSDVFYVAVEGGTVLRYEDEAMLYGIAVRGRGHVHLEASTGGSFGASVSAHAGFAVAAKLIAYLSAHVQESMFYGEITLDLTLTFSIRVWLKTRWFKLSAGFSQSLTVHVGIELVVEPKGIGGHVEASVAVRAFGRTLRVGIGFTFGSDRLEEARGRVARFLQLGLGAEYPDPEKGAPVARAPVPEPPRDQVAKRADERTNEDAVRREIVAPPSTAPADDLFDVPGVPVRSRVEYWAMAFPVPSAPDYYLIQLVPRGLEPDTTKPEEASYFFAAPVTETGGLAEYLIDGLVRDDFMDPPSKEQPAPFSRTTDWTKPFGRNDPAGGTALPPMLGEVFATTCFMAAPTDKTQQATDPYLHTWGDREELHDDPEARTRQIADAAQSRADLGPKLKRSQEVDEARSSVIATLCQCAEELAGLVTITGAGPSVGPAVATLEVDPRALGLTLLMKADRIKQLFPTAYDANLAAPPTSTSFTIATRRPAKTPVLENPTTVALFNPPGRWFRAAPPRLAAIEARRLPNGVQLYWDLEPAWGESTSTFNDPEYHLRHYRIERRILGVDPPPPPRIVTTKGAEQLKACASDAAKPVRFVRLHSRLQVVDDLTDVPEQLRKELLPPARDEDALTSLPRNVRTIVYVVVPIDIAGTPGDASTLAVRVDPPRLVQATADRAVARFDYGYYVPRLGTWSPPSLFKEFFSIYVEEKKRPDTRFENYYLRIRTERTVAAGVFGADALSEARAEPAPPTRDDLPNPANEIDVLMRPVGTVKDSIPVNVRRVRKPRVPNPDDPEVVDDVTYFITPTDWGRVVTQLGIGNDPRVQAARMYLRPEPLLELGKSDDTKPLRPAWVPVQLQMQIGRPSPKTKTRPVDVTVERFEHPIDVRFQSIPAENLLATSGRLHVYHPAIDATFEKYVCPDSNAVTLLRDGERRTGVRLDWNARPSDLAAFDPGYTSPLAGDPSPTPTPAPIATGSDALQSLVGGFDVFTVDATAIPKDGKPLDHVVPIGRVQRAPAAARGQEPSETGELARIDVFYPSETFRLKNATHGRRRAVWYSPAESMLLWPRRVLRRSVLTSVDEVELAHLFDAGKPREIWVRWKTLPWPNANTPTLVISTSLKDRVTCAKVTHKPTPDSAPDWVGYVLRAKAGLFDVDLARRALLALAIDAGVDPKLDNEPQSFTDVEFELTGFFATPADVGPWPPETGNATLITSLAPALHPILADVLELLQYENLQEGPAYRRYEPVIEAAPPVNAKTLVGFLDETAPDRDPAGWGVLRTFGLAASFRVYDAQAGAFLGPIDTRNLLEKVLAVVTPRYTTVGWPLGALFVDVMSTADGLSELASFHGAAPDPADPDKNVADNALALVQVELRPTVLSSGTVLRPGEPTVGPIIRYARIYWKPTEPALSANPAAVVLSAMKDFVLVELDAVVPPAGTVSRRALLLKDWATDQPFPSGGSDRIDGAVAVEIAPNAVPTGDGYLLAYARFVALTPEASLGNLAEIVQAKGQAGAVVVVPEGEPNVVCEDGAWGRFADLPDGWTAALLFGDGLAHFPEGKRPSPSSNYRYPAARDTLDTIVAELARRGDGKEAAMIGQEPAPRRELAGRLGPWGRRFMEHGPTRPMAPKEVGLALAMLTRPDPWRVSPNPDGRLSILLLEKDRYGKTRKYAVRPFGRYDNLTAATYAEPPSADGEAEFARHWSELMRPSLAHPKVFGGRADALYSRFADATIERSEPLAAPVILATRRVKDRVLEVVVSRHPEEIIADANIRTDAAIAMRHVGIGFWREFADPRWADAIHTRVEPKSPPIDLLQSFGPFAEPRWEAPPKPKGLTIDGNVAVRELYERHPDLWRGAYVLRMSDMPYGFRFHAAAHAAAGVVVSPSAVALVEGPAAERKYFPWCVRPADPRLSGWQENALPAPRWKVVVTDDGRRAVEVDWPLVRLVDGVDADARAIWFGTVGAPSLYRLPDPGVGYQLAVETEDGASRAGEADVAPIADPKANAVAITFYLAQLVGKRFDGAVVQDVVPRNPSSDSKHYAIVVRLRLPNVALPKQAPIPGGTTVDVDRLPDLGANDAIDVVVEVAVPENANRTSLDVQNAIANLQATPNTDITREALARMISIPTAGARVPMPWSTRLKTQPILQVLAGTVPPPLVRTAIQVVLRFPATNDECTRLGDAHLTLVSLTRDLTKTAVLGPRRRLTLLAFDGGRPPMSATIEGPA